MSELNLNARIADAAAEEVLAISRRGLVALRAEPPGVDFVQRHEAIMRHVVQAKLNLGIPIRIEEQEEKVIDEYLATLDGQGPDELRRAELDRRYNMATARESQYRILAGMVLQNEFGVFDVNEPPFTDWLQAAHSLIHAPKPPHTSTSGLQALFSEWQLSHYTSKMFCDGLAGFGFYEAVREGAHRDLSPAFDSTQASSAAK